jgi:Tfp pilus assembly protein PilO
MTTVSKRIFAVAGGAALVILVAWYMLLFRPANHRLSAAHTAHAAAEQQIAQLNSTIGSLMILKQHVPADKARLAALEAQLPDSPQLASDLNQLQAAAAATGVDLTSVAPTAPAGASGANGAQASVGTPAITLTLTAGGTYQQLMAFLTKCNALPRVMVIDHMSLSGVGNQLTANMGARIFYAGAPTP